MKLDKKLTLELKNITLLAGKQYSKYTKSHLKKISKQTNRQLLRQI